MKPAKPPAFDRPPPPRPAPPATQSPSLLPAILVGSAIAVSGLVAAGVIVFVFGGRRPPAPPVARPADTAAMPAEPKPSQSQTSTVPQAATGRAPREPVAREVDRTPMVVTQAPPQPAAEAGPKRVPETAGPPPAPPQPALPETPAAVAAVDQDGSMNAPPPPAATGAARAAEPPVTQAAVEPEPPHPQSAEPAAIGAAALVAALPEAIDIIPAAAALGALRKPAVDLGPCAPAAAALLEMAIAQPAEQGPDEVGRLRVTPAEPATDGWRIDQLEPGIDKEVPRGVATLAVRDDRLTAAAATSLPPGTARMLARSVLLVRVRGAAAWKPVRLVRPETVGSLALPALGEERGRMPLPLPAPFAGHGLPPGIFLELETDTHAENELVLEPPRDRPDKPFGTEYAQRELPDGTKVVVRIRIEPQQGEERQPVLLVETGIGGLEGKRTHERQRLGKLMALGKTHQKVLADTFAGWDKAVEGLLRKPIESLRPGDVEALFKAPLPMSPRLPPIPVSLQPLAREFDEFLIRNEEARRGGFRASSDLPGTLADWERDWQDVYRDASSYYPSYVQREWSDHFQRPLQACWDDYRPRAVAAVTEAVDAVATLAAREVRIDVKRVAVNAVGTDGDRYVVPLLVGGDDRGGNANRAGAAGDGRTNETD